MQLRIKLLGDRPLEFADCAIGGGRRRITVPADDEEKKAGKSASQTPSPPEPRLAALSRDGGHGDGRCRGKRPRLRRLNRHSRRLGRKAVSERRRRRHRRASAPRRQGRRERRRQFVVAHQRRRPGALSFRAIRTIPAGSSKSLHLPGHGDRGDQRYNRCSDRTRRPAWKARAYRGLPWPAQR